MAKDQDKDLDKKQEDQGKDLTAIEFITKLVEDNKDDEDFIINANKVVEELKGNKTDDLTKENERLRADLSKSKKKFFDTFMGNVQGDDIDNKVEEDEEKKENILKLDDILSDLERK